MISGIINNINKYKNEQIKVFDIEMTSIEKKAFETFNVTTTKIYRNFGNSCCIDKEVYDYYASIGQNTFDDISIIKDYTIRLVYAVIEGFEKDSFWLDIRASIPNDSYKIPRWHIDGKFYDITNREKPNYKFITTPKGPGTLFAQCDEDYKKKFFEKFLTNAEAQIEIDNRTMLDTIVKHCI